MFLKAVPKKDKSTGITYTYYRLCEGFRIDGKIRHRNIMSLGRLDQLTTDQQRKQLADHIEQLYKNLPSPLFPSDIIVEQLARQFAARLRGQQTLHHHPDVATPLVPAKTGGTDTPDFDNIDLNSIRHDEVRELGAEWMCRQTATQLKIEEVLKQNGFNDQDIQLAITQVISRAVYPASELKTQNWIQLNSAVALLQGIEPSKVSRNQLYQSALNLYERKEQIELHLSKTTNEIFSLDDKIVFYDLTNTYFEGRKDSSKMAQFGRSKEKRSDCKLIVLALVVNAEGFVKTSKLYAGDTADCTTLADIIGSLKGSKKTVATDKKTVVALDAGIATNDNIKWLLDNGYDYISVSRVKLKDYTLARTTPVIITDNRNHPIELNLVEEPADNGDRFLYVHSQLKEVKETSMDNRAAAKLEEELKNLNNGLGKKGATKKYDSIMTRTGRIIERNKAVSKFYEITVTQKDGMATNVAWKVKEIKKEHGIYFLRTSLKDKDEKTLWNIYNTLTEIEASFRILKTDLEMRPVFHQKDKSTEAHLFLAILAYSLVATIRHQLKAKGIKDDWREIVRKMNSQKLVTTSMKNDKGKIIVIQRPGEPQNAVWEIYTALNYKPKPWTRKKFVLPDL